MNIKVFYRYIELAICQQLLDQRTMLQILSAVYLACHLSKVHLEGVDATQLTIYFSLASRMKLSSYAAFYFLSRQGCIV